MEKTKECPVQRRPATNQHQSLPPKRRGEIAELAFMQKVVSLGFAVAKPWGDSERYDYILDAGGRFWRVQVGESEAELSRDLSGPLPMRAIADTLSILTSTQNAKWLRSPPTTSIALSPTSCR